MCLLQFQCSESAESESIDDDSFLYSTTNDTMHSSAFDLDAAVLEDMLPDDCDDVARVRSEVHLNRMEFFSTTQSSSSTMGVFGTRIGYNKTRVWFP